MIISINTRWCSQEQADSFFSFAWDKIFLQSDKGKSQSDKMQQEQDKNNRTQKVEIWRMMTRTDHSETEEMCGSLGCFWKYDTYWWQAYLLPSKLAPLCVSGSDAWEVLSCLPRACTACRESWRVAAPDGAASLEPIQAQIVLHKNTWETESKDVQSLLLLQKAEILLVSWIPWNPGYEVDKETYFLNYSFLQSKFRRLEQELPFYLYLTTSHYEGWSLRCVKDIITHQ